VSKLAQDAGVSVSVVRDYVLRALFEAGIGLSELVRLCHALDGQSGDAGDCLAHLRVGRSTALHPEWLAPHKSLLLDNLARADLAQRDAALRPLALEHLRKLVVIGTPAMKARGRKLLARLAKSKGR